MLGIHVTAIEKLDGRKKLFLEERLPPPDTRQRRRRSQHWTVAALRTVVAFDAPDRGEDVAVDAIAALGLVEYLFVLRQQLASACDARVGYQRVEIFPERLGEFRLGVD